MAPGYSCQRAVRANQALLQFCAVALHRTHWRAEGKPVKQMINGSLNLEGQKLVQKVCFVNRILARVQLLGRLHRDFYQAEKHGELL